MTRAKNAMQEDTDVIRIGSSPMMPAQLLMQIWPKIQVHCPDLKFQIIPPGWANVHPLLKVIPVEWDHSIPYGLLHSPHPSRTVKHFLAAVQAAIQ